MHIELINLNPAVIYTQESFAIEVERRVNDDECEFLLESATEIIEEMDCEPSECMNLFNSTLISKIEAESARRGMFKEQHKTFDLSDFM